MSAPSGLAAEELFDDFWAWRMEESPELASFCGNHDYDHRLDDVSENGYTRRAVSCGNYHEHIFVFHDANTL